MGSLQGLPLWEERGHECEVGGWKFLSALLPAAGARKRSPGAMLGHSRAAMLGFAATVRRETCWKLSLHYQADFGGNPGWTALARLKNGRDKLKFKLFCLQGCKLCSVLRQAVSELHPYFSCGTP